MSEHWQRFLIDVPWYLDGRPARAGRLEAPGSWQASADFESRFPTLYRLLRSSCLTRVSVADEEYVLHSWAGAESAVRAWLCELPVAQVPPGMFEAHQVLAASFGGIVERSNEPEGSWLLNHNEALTAREAEHDARFVRDYEWAFAGIPGGIPIDLEAHYSIAREANGNTTLCERSTGRVLLFAPDHSFDHVVPLEGCPEYSLYRIPGAESFCAWVDVVAAQWT